MSLPTITLTSQQYQRMVAYRIDPLMRSRVVIDDTRPLSRWNGELDGGQVRRDVTHNYLLVRR